MCPTPSRVLQRVVVKEEERFGTPAVGVLLQVVGVAVVRPMLLHPEPLGSTNEIGTESQHVIDPSLLRRRTVVGIVLDVEADSGLRDTVQNGQSDGASLEAP